MNLNGQVLKVSFLSIMATLCVLLLILTGLAACGRLAIEMYERLLGVLGIPTLFGMVAQSFIHSNINQEGVNYEKNPVAGSPIAPAEPKQS